MFPNPCENIFVLHTSVRDGEPEPDHIGVGCFDADSVQLQKAEHDVYADAFVAVNESMVGDKRKADFRCLFLLAGI